VKREDLNKLIGKVVSRGPNWIWGDQDSQGKGIIVPLPEKEGELTEGWVRVRWSDGYENIYRMGAQGCIDLYIYHDEPTSIEAVIDSVCINLKIMLKQ